VSTDRTETEALELAAYRAAFGTLRLLLAEHVSDALLSGDDAEHRRIVRLARRLDESGLDLKGIVDGFVTDTYEARTDWAWKSPAARREASALAEDPWAAGGDGEGWDKKPVTLPEPVQRVLVDQIAEMRVREGWKPDELRLRAVHMASELACAGVDLYAAIDERTQELKPGTPPLHSEPPF